jgi:hypothetical protein
VGACTLDCGLEKEKEQILADRLISNKLHSRTFSELA